jgi:hypothetical protein
VISQSQVRDGPIFAILDKNIKEVVAYSGQEDQIGDGGLEEKIMSRRIRNIRRTLRRMIIGIDEGGLGVAGLGIG